MNILHRHARDSGSLSLVEAGGAPGPTGASGTDAASATEITEVQSHVTTSRSFGAYGGKETEITEAASQVTLTSRQFVGAYGGILQEKLRVACAVNSIIQVKRSSESEHITTIISHKLTNKLNDLR
jgi:hypothetical protein